MTGEELSVHYSEEQVSALMDDMVDAWYEFQASLSEHRGHNQRFDRVTSQVTEILPRDVPIEHTYQGGNPERSGTYVITHTSTDYGQIKVERAAE